MVPLFAVLCIVLVSVNAFYGGSSAKNVVKSHHRGKSKVPALLAELKLLIQGTKNAYTTLRTGDIVYYQHENSSSDDETRALGLFTAEGTIAPLCNHVDESREVFYLDKEQEPLSANGLIEEGKLLRIVSSDKRGNKYLIEEYIDRNDVFIPVRDPSLPYQASDDWGTEFNMPPATPEVIIPPIDTSAFLNPSMEPQDPSRTSISHTDTSPSTFDKEIELVRSKLEVASLKVKLIELEMAREKNR